VVQVRILCFSKSIFTNLDQPSAAPGKRVTKKIFAVSNAIRLNLPQAETGVLHSALIIKTKLSPRP